MRTKLAIIGAAVCLARAALAVTMASQPWTTSRIAEAEARVASNIVEAIDGIPAPDYSTGNATLVATIEATAPAPGDYANVSNRAMSAIQEHQSLWPAVAASTNYTDAALGAFAATGSVARATAYGTSSCFTDATGCVWSVTGVYADWHISTNGIPFKTIVRGDTTWGDGYTYMSYDYEDWYFTGSWIDGSYAGPEDILSFAVTTYIYSYGDLVEAEVEFARDAVYVYQTNLVGRVALTNDIPDVSGYATQQQATNAATAVADTKISTNNEAFVSAVLAVPIAGADAGDLAEIAEYGGYGTVGAAVLALIAGLAALKRSMGTAETALAGKMPMYPMVAVTPSSGTLTVTPYTVATYTADTFTAAFTVAVGTGTAGTARDCELVIDCTATGAVAPTVTWPATFHPRTDAATDFACEAGVRNVYFISEYAAGEFAVGGWQEPAGGNT